MAHPIAKSKTSEFNQPLIPVVQHEEIETCFLNELLGNPRLNSIRSFPQKLKKHSINQINKLFKRNKIHLTKQFFYTDEYFIDLLSRNINKIELPKLPKGQIHRLINFEEHFISSSITEIQLIYHFGDTLFSCNWKNLLILMDELIEVQDEVVGATEFLTFEIAFKDIWSRAIIKEKHIDSINITSKSTTINLNLTIQKHIKAKPMKYFVNIEVQTKTNIAVIKRIQYQLVN